MYTAAQAKKTYDKWLEKATYEHDKEYNRIMAKENREAHDAWNERGQEWVDKIEGWIRKASANGQRGTYEPSCINPNGDQVIWLQGRDQKIHKLLMAYFRNNGYTVTEYSPFAMKIEW